MQDLFDNYLLKTRNPCGFRIIKEKTYRNQKLDVKIMNAEECRKNVENKFRYIDNHFMNKYCLEILEKTINEGLQKSIDKCKDAYIIEYDLYKMTANHIDLEKIIKFDGTPQLWAYKRYVDKLMESNGFLMSEERNECIINSIFEF